MITLELEALLYFSSKTTRLCYDPAMSGEAGGSGIRIILSYYTEFKASLRDRKEKQV